MKDKIIEIGKELYSDLNKKQLTDLVLDKEGVERFVELLSGRIEPLCSVGEEVYVECEPDDALYTCMDLDTGETVPIWIKKLTRPTVSEEEIEIEGWERYPQHIYNNGEDEIFAEGAKWVKELLNSNHGATTEK